MLCETFTPENANSFQEFLCLGAVLTISRSLTTALVIEPRDSQILLFATDLEFNLPYVVARACF
ncbi:hypothetical protein SCA6_016185 [Theobroma cacao]